MSDSLPIAAPPSGSRAPLTLAVALLSALALGPLARGASAQGVPVPAPSRTTTLPPRAEAAARSLEGLSDAAGRLLAARAVPLAIGRGPSGEVEADVFVRARRGVERDLRARGVRVGTRAGDWVTARVPLARLAEIARVPGVSRVEIARRARPTADSGVVDIGAPTVRGREFRDQFQGATGRGAIVGFVDTGIDFQHPDFLEDDQGRSRILYLWDQTADGTGPGRVGDATFDYGVECTRATLGASGQCAERDYEGHGTHVAGTAVGDGSAARVGVTTYDFTGVAPGAEIIAVKTDFSFASIIDGVDYVFRRAAELHRPAVVNLSLGAQFGPHDGTEIPSLALDALSGPGRIVVAAAGNEGSNGTDGTTGFWPTLHAEGRAPALGDTVVIAFDVSNYVPSSGSANDLLIAQCFYQQADTFSAVLVRPSGDTVRIGVAPASVVSPSAAGGVVAYNGSVAGDSILGPALELGTFSPTSPWGTLSLYVGEWIASAPPRAGRWKLVLTKQGGTGTGQVDAYLSLSTLRASVQFTIGATNRRLVGVPGDARRVITVGGYSTRHTWPSVDGNVYQFAGDGTLTGDLLAFSSPGPTLDGRRKPEITAPGRVLSSLSSATRVDYHYVTPDSSHVIFEGTSMAAPHVAGAVALLLARRPTLTPEEALTALAGGARQDAFTAVSHSGDGGLPSDSWGSGKLDVPGALAGVSPLAGRGYAADNPDAGRVRSSVRGTLLPLQSLRIAAADAESLDVRTIGATVDGRDRGIRFALALDADHDGEVGPGDTLLAASDPVTLDGPRYVSVTPPPGSVRVPRGGAVDLILVGELSGATPNATSFTGEVLPDSSVTVGVRSGAAVTLGGLGVGRALLRTTLMAAGERVNFSQNPVRSAPLTINFAEAAHQIAVYDYAGRLVRTIVPDVADRFVRWDLRADDGALVVPGTYLVLLDLTSGVVRRKLFITR